MLLGMPLVMQPLSPDRVGVLRKIVRSVLGANQWQTRCVGGATPSVLKVTLCRKKVNFNSPKAGFLHVGIVNIWVVSFFVVLYLRKVWQHLWPPHARCQ